MAKKRGLHLINLQTRRQLLASTALAGFAAMMVVNGAQAQNSSAATGAASAGATQEVVVTGSRLVRKDFSSTSPVSTVSGEVLALTATTGTEQLLNELPQVIPGNTFTSNNAGGENFATVDLRGLGPQRTLVIVNGERVPPSSSTGVVDLNTIPAGLIDHIEVVTGGASTVYGSDAVGGVVNFVMRQNFEGAELNASYRQTGDGKAPETSISGLVGGNFANGRGNLVAYGSYFNRDAVSQAEYEFSKTSAAIIDETTAAGADILHIYNSAAAYNAAKAANPTSAFSTFLSGGSATPPWGLIRNNGSNPFKGLNTNPATAGTFGSADTDCNPATASVAVTSYTGGLSFNDAGKLSPQLNTGSCAVPDRAAGSSRYNFAPTNLIVLPAERYTFTTFGRYQVTDTITAKINLSYANSKTGVQLAATPVSSPPADITFNLTPAESSLIQTRHPDFYAALQSRANPNAPFTEALRTLFLGPRIGVFTDQSFYLLTTLDGKINTRWSWSATGSYGKTDLVAVLKNNANKSALFAAASGCQDSTGAPLVGTFGGGLIGCTPLDPFGPGNGADVANYIRTDTKTQTDFSQQRLAGFIRGDLFDLPAGAVSTVFGAEYRNERAAVIVDDQQRRSNIFGFNAAQNQVGGQDVYELYTEVGVPLVSNAPLVRSLSVEAGYRYSEYSTAGNVNTYKFGGEYSPVSWLKFRGIYNRATRAPSVFELFQNGDQGFPSYTDPCRAAAKPSAALTAFCVSQRVAADPGIAAQLPTFVAANSQTQALTFGNPNLAPETADTYTGGLVLTPDLGRFGKLRATVDYFNIKIRGLIATFGAGFFISDCYNNLGAGASAASCARLSYDATGNITNVNATRANNPTPEHTSGEDVQVEWTATLGNLPYLSRVPGRLRVTELFSYVNSFKIGSTQIADTTGAGVGGAVPRYKSVLSGFYDVGPWTAFLRWSYVPEIRQDFVGSSFQDTGVPKAPAASYVDGAISWNASPAWRVTVTVDNLFDKRAPETLSGVLGGQANTDAQVYSQGILGRVFALSIRSRF